MSFPELIVINSLWIQLSYCHLSHILSLVWELLLGCLPLDGVKHEAELCGMCEWQLCLQPFSQREAPSWPGIRESSWDPGMEGEADWLTWHALKKIIVKGFSLDYLIRYKCSGTTKFWYKPHGKSEKCLSSSGKQLGGAVNSSNTEQILKHSSFLQQQQVGVFIFQVVCVYHHRCHKRLPAHFIIVHSC